MTNQKIRESIEAAFKRGEIPAELYRILTDKYCNNPEVWGLITVGFMEGKSLKQCRNLVANQRHDIARERGILSASKVAEIRSGKSKGKSGDIRYSHKIEKCFGTEFPYAGKYVIQVFSCWIE